MKPSPRVIRLRVLGERQHLAVAPERRLAQREVAGAHLVRRALEVVAGEERSAAAAEV